MDKVFSVGAKVRYTGTGSHDGQYEYIEYHGVEVGGVLTVEYASWTLGVTFEEIPGYYDPEMFEDVEEV